MTDKTKRQIRWPDGWSGSIALRPFPIGIGGTYYSNPGSPTAPRATVTGWSRLVEARARARTGGAGEPCDGT